jgi:hypothetical protein
LLADAEMTMGGVRYLIELDTGKMTHRQLKARFKKLAGTTDTILFVTLARARRLRGVLKTASAFDFTFVATTFPEVYADPFGKVWRERDGTLRQVNKPPA